MENIKFLISYDRDLIGCVEKEVNVFQVKEFKFLGKKFIFRIIGSSHYISSDELSYLELFSCFKPEIKFDFFDELDFNLTEDFSRELVFNFEKYVVNIYIDVKDLKIDLDVSYDLYYDFGKDAFTGIKLISDKSYETIHTYPEFNKMVITKTEFTLK